MCRRRRFGFLGGGEIREARSRPIETWMRRRFTRETSTGFRKRVLNAATAGQHRRTRPRERIPPTGGGNKIGRRFSPRRRFTSGTQAYEPRDVFRAYGRISTVTYVCCERRSDPVRNSSSSPVELLSFRPDFVGSEPGRRGPDEVAFAGDGTGGAEERKICITKTHGVCAKIYIAKSVSAAPGLGISYRTNEYLQRVKHSRPEAIR